MRETRKRHSSRTTRRMSSIHAFHLCGIPIIRKQRWGLERDTRVTNRCLTQTDKLIITVMLWDEFGNIAISTQPHDRIPLTPKEYDESNLSPRYLIVRLVARTKTTNNGLDQSRSRKSEKSDCV
mmetsp:Transcript_3660/g.4234  ORF Transcript_3660/g.4234 Transcript_3660/m.4234 type:complete len:124 (-) Transcript_3660:159-530(-)